jgi:glyoxylate carboligase
VTGDYARATGDNLGVLKFDIRRSLTNAVTGIATAYMDSIPVVITSAGRSRLRPLVWMPSEIRNGHHAPHRQTQLPGQDDAIWLQP